MEEADRRGPHAALLGPLRHTPFYPPEVIPEFYWKILLSRSLKNRKKAEFSVSRKLPRRDSQFP